MAQDNRLTMTARRPGRLASGVFAAVFLLLLPIAECVQAGDAPSEEVRAYVGGEAITSGELEALKDGPLADADDAARLRYAIRKKALMQKALSEGVYREPGYIESMEAFRERALIQALLEKKSREIAGKTAVTEKEVEVFAGRMCYTVRFYEKEFGEKKDADAFMADSRAKKTLEWDGEVTVVGCENIGPLMADAVFGLEEGEVGVVVRGRRFTVVKLVEKSKTIEESELPDRERIRQFLLEKKVSEALDGWVDKVAGEAKVGYPGARNPM